MAMSNLAFETSIGSTRISEKEIKGIRSIITYWKRIGVLLTEAVDRAILETENSARYGKECSWNDETIRYMIDNWNDI